MRKLLAGLFTVILLLISTIAIAETKQRNTYKSGNWEYQIQSDGTVQLTNYFGEERTLDIPEKIAGKKVTSIGDYACAYTGQIRYVTIPDCIIDIGNNPFVHCRIDNIYVSPEHPTLAIIDDVLFSKPDKRLIYYPSLKSDKSYVIPNGIKVIGGQAFTAADYLVNITLPDTLTTMIGNPFAYCTHLEHLYISSYHQYFSVMDGVLFNKSNKELVCYPITKTESRYGIPAGIKCISDYAFAACKNLFQVNLPDSITSIGNYAFCGCRSLSTINIPSHATHIGEAAFESTGAIESITLPYGMTTIHSHLFYASLIQQINLPSTITHIEEGAFGYTDYLRSITIPEGVSTIEYGAFAFSGLQSIILPRSLNNIGFQTFEETICTLTVPRDSYAAEYCKANNLRYTYPDSLDWLTAP